MTDNESSPGPRRSQREKKQAVPFRSVNSALIKRKRADATTDEEGLGDGELSEPDDQEADEDERGQDEEFDAPKAKQKAAAKPARKTAGKAKVNGPPPTKKPRTKKAAAAPKTKSTATKRRGRAAAPVEGREYDAEQVAKDTKVAGDNALFNAIMNPSAALQSTAEDFLESLVQTPGPTQAELINAILRSCGCNDAVDADEVVDYDGVVDALDNFTEALKQDDSPVYPLTSKLPAFKKFRKSLSEFLSRLISSAAAMGSLYSSDLLPTLQTWVVAMSSSHLRAFRHTATVVALEVETALCEVAADVEKEAEIVSRQREGERKRRAKNKGEGANAREKELEGKAAEVRERRTKLAEFLKEFVDGVFVHRYRDLDPNIRAECVRAMGLWFSKYPAHFLDGTYLRYVGWVLSDSNTHVRLEAVKALSLAYAQTEYIGVGALQHFTERFKPRLVQMAIGDTELTVRVAVVQVLQAIDMHGLLEDEQTEKLCLLVFDEEAKVRKAVSGFVKGVWAQVVEERLVGKKANRKDKQKAGVKALAMLLVQWGKALDQKDGDMDSDDEESQSAGPSTRRKGKEMATLVGPEQKGRTALAVEALWDEVEPVSDWETILDVLLLDHSASDEASPSQSRTRRTAGKASTKDADIDEVWRLEEVEETALLEVLIASLRKTKSEVAGSKKGEDEAVSSDITRALIKGLPGLFVKYQTDENRMANVLLLPQLMNIDMYLEMRMMTAYDSLWGDITKQFMSHSALPVLTNAVSTIRHLMEATSLSNNNSTRIVELEDELSTSLRDAIAGRDELELASLSEDEVLALTAICARLAVLAGTRDMTAWMEDDDGGKQSNAWDIISALAERGRLGYKEEEMMMDQALHVLTLHIIWKTRHLVGGRDLSPEELEYRDRLKEQRDSLLVKLLEFAVGTQSNTAEGVRRAAFQNLMNLHILFCPAQSVAPDGSDLPTASLALSLDDEVQYRCAGFVQAEIERYAEEFEESLPADESGSDEDGSDFDQVDDEAMAKKGKSKKKKQPLVNALENTPRSKLEREYVFIGLVATFLRAIRAGAVHFRHSATLLAHYGRLGPAFDLCSKLIVDILREEGMYKNNGEAVVAVIVQALRDSFLLFLDGIAHSEEHSISLAKLLVSCLLIRGAQLAVVRKLDSQYVVEIQTKSLTWAGKRIAAYETQKNKKARNKSILFFKVLAPLLKTIDSRDSLKIKAHVDQLLAQAKLEVSATSKIWEAYRTYEKRLTAAKDRGSGLKGKRASKKDAKSAEFLTTDEEGDEDGVEEHDVAHMVLPPARKPKPKPKPVYRSARNASGTESEPEDVADGALSEPPPMTPERHRSQPSSRMTSPAASERSPKSPEDRNPVTPTPTTPVPSRKRPRSFEAEEEDADTRRSVDRDVVDSQPSSPTPLPASQETQVSEIQVRRKRVRH